MFLPPFQCYDFSPFLLPSFAHSHICRVKAVKKKASLASKKHDFSEQIILLMEDVHRIQTRDTEVTNVRIHFSFQDFLISNSPSLLFGLLSFPSLLSLLLSLFHTLISSHPSPPHRCSFSLKCCCRLRSTPSTTTLIACTKTETASLVWWALPLCLSLSLSLFHTNEHTHTVTLFSLVSLYERIYGLPLIRLATLSSLR